MALPKQVEQDLRELEAYEKSLVAPVVNEETPPVAAEPPAPVQPEVPVKAVTEVPVVEVKPDAWEQKYRTLEGKYNAEVPRLHAQAREMTAKLQELQTTIETLQRTPSPPATNIIEPLVTATDESEYGKELLDVQRRVAQDVFRERVAPLQEEIRRRDTEIKELVQALNKTDNTVNTMSFEQRLALAVPDFNQINADPVWIAYLEEPDPYTGEPRRVFAEFAYNNGLVDKVKQVVTHFKSTIGQKPNTPTAEETERAQRQAELDRQITPTRTNSQPTTAVPQNARIYTEREMVVGFDQVRKLNAANKYDDAAKLEAELSLAYMENRVRG